MLKRTPSLTEQTKSLLKQRILDQEFAGGRIPAETELARELGVSRTTIRAALNRLELEGAIFRRQGAGTFINQASLQIKTRLEEIWSYEAMLEAHGYTPSTQIISVEEQPASPRSRTDLSLKAAEPVIVIKKLFLADEQPVIFTLNYLPRRLIEVAYRLEDFHQPIYQFLAASGQQRLSYYLSEIVPLISPEWLVTVLKLPQPQTALLSFEEVGYNQDNQPILRTQSFFRDDLLRLRLIRREMI